MTELIIPIESLNFDAAMKQAREFMIRLALTKSGGNRCKAAELLGVHRNTVNRHMELLDLMSAFPSDRGRRPKH